MAESTLQPVEGGLLSSLAQLFFKGLDKLLDSAAEYAEEMGVLKQITRIPFKGTDGKLHTLTIKLSPVRDKDGYYYVETQSDLDEFDVSSLNDKVIRLNKNNTRGLEENILKLLEKNNCKWTDEKGNEKDISDLKSGSTDSEESEGDEEDQDDPGESDDLVVNSGKFSSAQKRDIEGMIQWMAEGAKQEGILIRYNNENCRVNIEFNLNKAHTYCKLTFTLSNHSDIAPWSVDVPTTMPFDQVHKNKVPKGAEILTEDEFKSAIKKSFNSYIEKALGEDFVTVSKKGFFAKKRVQGTFIKAKDQSYAELTAINANFNILAAMDMINEVSENDEFMNLLSENPISLEITDTPGGYEIEEISEVDTTNTYDDLFRITNELENKIRSFYWAIGSSNWYRNSFLDSLKYTVEEASLMFASWVAMNTNHFAIPSCSILPEVFDEIIDENGRPRTELVASVLRDDVIEMLDSWETYYTNLSHEEQTEMDERISALRNMVNFAEY